MSRAVLQDASRASLGDATQEGYAEGASQDGSRTWALQPIKRLQHLAPDAETGRLLENVSLH